jgi:hypothetical protein
VDIVIAILVGIITSLTITLSMSYMRKQSEWEMGYLSGWSDAKRFLTNKQETENNNEQ